MRRKILVVIVLLISIYVLLKINSEVKGESGSGSTSDLQLIARAINGEARGEDYEGQVAVGAVILNRVKDSRFPNTIARRNIRTWSFYCSFRWTNKSSNR